MNDLHSTMWTYVVIFTRQIDIITPWYKSVERTGSPLTPHNYPLVQMSRIDEQTLVLGVHAKANRKFEIG